MASRLKEIALDVLLNQGKAPKTVGRDRSSKAKNILRGALLVPAYDQSERDKQDYDYRRWVQSAYDYMKYGSPLEKIAHPLYWGLENILRLGRKTGGLPIRLLGGGRLLKGIHEGMLSAIQDPRRLTRLYDWPGMISQATGRPFDPYALHPRKWWV